MSQSYLQYSYQFGLDVVQKFSEKYARGTKICGQMLDISHEELCIRLIRQVRTNNQVKWEAAKRVIKLLEHDRFENYKDCTPADRRKYLTICFYNAEDEFLDQKVSNYQYSAQLPLDGV